MQVKNTKMLILYFSYLPPQSKNKSKNVFHNISDKIMLEISQELIVDYKQRTLMHEVGCTGIGLHTGKKVRINLKPAPSDSGIKFARTDLKGCPEVEVSSSFWASFVQLSQSGEST